MLATSQITRIAAKRQLEDQRNNCAGHENLAKKQKCFPELIPDNTPVTKDITQELELHEQQKDGTDQENLTKEKKYLDEVITSYTPVTNDIKQEHELQDQQKNGTDTENLAKEQTCLTELISDNTAVTRDILQKFEFEYQQNNGTDQENPVKQKKCLTERILINIPVTKKTIQKFELEDQQKDDTDQENLIKDQNCLTEVIPDNPPFTKDTIQKLELKDQQKEGADQDDQKCLDELILDTTPISKDTKQELNELEDQQKQGAAQENLPKDQKCLIEPILINIPVIKDIIQKLELENQQKDDLDELIPDNSPVTKDTTQNLGLEEQQNDGKDQQALAKEQKHLTAFISDNIPIIKGTKRQFVLKEEEKLGADQENLTKKQRCLAERILDHAPVTKYTNSTETCEVQQNATSFNQVLQSHQINVSPSAICKTQASIEDCGTEDKSSGDDDGNSKRTDIVKSVNVRRKLPFSLQKDEAIHILNFLHAGLGTSVLLIVTTSTNALNEEVIVYSNMYMNRSTKSKNESHKNSHHAEKAFLADLTNIITMVKQRDSKCDIIKVRLFQSNSPCAWCSQDLIPVKTLMQSSLCTPENKQSLQFEMQIEHIYKSYHAKTQQNLNKLKTCGVTLAPLDWLLFYDGLSHWIHTRPLRSKPGVQSFDVSGTNNVLPREPLDQGFKTEADVISHLYKVTQECAVKLRLEHKDQTKRNIDLLNTL